MADITKQPHYIYRYYLRAWAPNEQIHCLRARNKLFYTNLMNIGQEHLFYEFTACTDEEIAIGYHFAQNGCESIMDIYQYINNELRKVPFEQADDIKKSELSDFVKQFEETHFNCKIEERLKAILPVLYKKEFSFLDDETVAMVFFHAIAEQYCRTKKIKEATNNAMIELRNPNIRGYNVWLLIRHSLASKIGLSLFCDKYQVCLLENLDGNFITSDQPVINIHADCGNKIPEKFELYYPISPSLALIISKQEKYPNRKILSVDNAETMIWNERMVALSYNQLFSDKKNILEEFRIGG